MLALTTRCEVKAPVFLIADRCFSVIRTTSPRSWTWTCRRFPIKTFAALLERNCSTCTGLRQPDDINAVEIISLPIRDDGGIATMLGDEKTG